MVREIHIEHISNLNSKSCSLFHLDLVCGPPLIKSPSNRTSYANNIVINCELFGDIFYSNIFMKPICNNTLIGLEVNGWRWHCRTVLLVVYVKIRSSEAIKSMCP
jgi:hypothetical protein